MNAVCSVENVFVLHYTSRIVINNKCWQSVCNVHVNMIFCILNFFILVSNTEYHNKYVETTRELLREYKNN